WTFGCVLFEMLAGRRAFDGATSSDAIAAVLTRDPDWSALPADLPYGIGRLLRRCLEKDTKQRLRDIADAHEHLRDDGRDELAPAVGEPAPRGGPIGRVASIAALSTLTGAFAILAAIHFREAPPPELRLQI